MFKAIANVHCKCIKCHKKIKKLNRVLKGSHVYTYGQSLHMQLIGSLISRKGMTF